MKSCINFVVKSMVISGIILTFSVISIWGWTELRKIKGDGLSSVAVDQVAILILGIFLFACLSAVIYSFAEKGVDNKMLKMSISNTPEEISRAIKELQRKLGADNAPQK